MLTFKSLSPPLTNPVKNRPASARLCCSLIFHAHRLVVFSIINIVRQGGEVLVLQLLAYRLSAFSQSRVQFIAGRTSPYTPVQSWKGKWVTEDRHVDRSTYLGELIGDSLALRWSSDRLHSLWTLPIVREICPVTVLGQFYEQKLGDLRNKLQIKTNSRLLCLSLGRFLSTTNSPFSIVDPRNPSPCPW